MHHHITVSNFASNMASSFRKLQLLLLHLLVLQEMIGILSEAAVCEAPSRFFSGACFSSHNCGTICETEGFANGSCKFFKCICSKDCNGGGGGRGRGNGGGSGGGEGGPPGGDDGPPHGPPAGGDGGSPDDTPPPTESYFINEDAYLNMNF